nr:MAG TPA_asm: Endonuclease [Caudoviricetes sp.]
MSSCPLRRILRQKKQSRGKFTYLADFVYEKGSQTIVEDVKGMKTDVYKIKRKLMLYFHGIKIKEVTKEVKTWAV